MTDRSVASPDTQLLAIFGDTRPECYPEQIRPPVHILHEAGFQTMELRPPQPSRIQNEIIQRSVGILGISGCLCNFHCVPQGALVIFKHAIEAGNQDPDLTRPLMLWGQLPHRGNTRQKFIDWGVQAVNRDLEKLQQIVGGIT